MWSISFKKNEQYIEIISNMSSVRWPAPAHGPCLSIPLESIRQFDNGDILEICRWFLDNAEEIDCICSASEAHYSEQFVSDEDLETIISSRLAQEGDIEAARQERFFRANPMSRPSERPAAKKKFSDKKGVVYLLKADNERYKIGVATDLKKRMKQLASVSPHALEVVHTIPSGAIYKAEAVLHERFAERRMNGEWFALLPEDVGYICGLEEL